VPELHGRRLTGKDVAVATAIAAISFAWLMTLSGWLNIDEATTAVRNDDVYFGVDASSWLTRIVGPTPAGLPDFELAPHPIAMQIWRPGGQVLLRGVQVGASAADSVPLTGRILVALLAALGTLGLALVARASEVSGARLWLIFAVALLSTANVIVALPDYYGVSYGLLAMFFAGFALATSPAARGTALPLLTLIIGGTTVTNAVLPLLAGLRTWIPGRWLRACATTALIASAPLALWIVTRNPPTDFLPQHIKRLVENTTRFTRLFIRNETLSTPEVFLEDAAMGVVYPIVAPASSMRTSGKALVFVPPRTELYGPADTVGAIGWLALVVASILGTPHSRRGLLFLLGTWLAFNLVFHAVWGDPPLLYSPHWSWALVAVVLLGASRVPLWFVTTACLATAFGQVRVLAAIVELARSIT
jgi:hypothetical protein